MKNVFEIIVGFLVIFIAVIFSYFVYQTSEQKLDKHNQYVINANFDNADGIKVGSEVKISGVVIGKVISQILDYDTYSAQVKFLVDKKIKLPEDSSAQIVSSNILGDKYISITPGTEEKVLADEDTIEFTQSSINLEGMISKFMFGLKDSNNSNSSSQMDDNGFLGNNKSDEQNSDEQNYIFNDSGTKNSIG
ncbi:outer membrane lipid asymmetry maintenance protein MlaD [Candidatus Bandiella numerosa]|jgi:phospholipid/cholesterol/gamma-HCH transport system substrate-binding protein|uniref:outer membrane lipid asymmetry maintenance protein MlaD n=1 Tax=Candidatus Bandiella numerosa TaxID=2570586 RepID=UPI00249F8396|nr:outer membrane lipid asymmetry maintenance protein MlaD [Candidatus Bandiella numerosa]WHA05370.1 outer membrane lipid asymmetry maintenance protein MlaD [Candidatus Bandiella numerosa]